MVSPSIQGPYALFTRPEMKVERVSYDVITPLRTRDIEAVYWKPPFAG
jgi:CRISPR-associated protein Cas5d